MKYRIAQLYNGNYIIQKRKNLFYRWEIMSFNQIQALSSAQYEIERLIAEDEKEKEIKKGNKICKIIP